MSLYVDVTWTRFCDESDPEARYGVAPVDIDRLGLRAAYEQYVAPPPPPDELKEAATPPNKAARRPSTK